MALQYINELLHLPELKIIDFHSKYGISLNLKKTYLYDPSIRMRCTRCCVDFVWVYGFVLTKRRYSSAFCMQAAELALGSTAVHSAYMQEAPVSTVIRMHQDMLKSENQRIAQKAWHQAERSTKLVLSVDDFAPAYHAWIRECFPAALNIVDRFHVQACVIESMQEVRKKVQSTLSSQSRKMLKSHHRLLNPPAEQLSKESKTQLEIILKYSTLLRRSWEWKESFTTWYDCSPSYELCVVEEKSLPITTDAAERMLR
ncbi:transposase [Paenibacillus sp. YIM B09110]|uniref:transposase n=1 Tax=Paenibacillus sp. YIM B09110 TaxID=3126102 RepID=UPI00301D6EC2